MSALEIDGRPVGPGHPVYVIAEIGFNHEGKVDLALEMIAAAAAAGAAAVKFQTYRAADLTLEEHPHFDLIKHGELDAEAHMVLAAAARRAGVHFLSTPFSPEAVDILERVGVPAYKVASMDVTYQPMLRKIARIGKPVILSTGMATLGEVDQAVRDIVAEGNRRIVLLHCTSHYPPGPENANLRTIGQLADAFGLTVGYSDHVLGNAAAIASVALGATVIEKHFTTDKGLPGPDHKISADPTELAALVRDVRLVEKALGRRCCDETRPDRDSAAATRRGLYAAQAVAAGTPLTAAMIKCVRPEGGLPPRLLDTVVGRMTRQPVEREAPFTFDNI